MHARCVVPANVRRGFTIVELLVVVGIIAVLAALITPAVIRARSAARNAAIKAEIDMLHMAVMNYKNEYGSFPPCLSGTLATDPAARHIKQIFPRTVNPAFEVRGSPTLPGNALVRWLGGYTNDPTCPVSGTNVGGPRRKLFDFDQSRISTGDMFAPVGRPNSPYVYLDSRNYGNLGSPTVYGVVIGSGTVDFAAQAQTLTSGVAFFNPDTFQILCAGQDGIFGTDSNTAGEDDLSNFWTGTRAQHKTRNQ
jgi:prepilin-type N-terminal cleavage/methylation domain-containing protein